MIGLFGYNVSCCIALQLLNLGMTPLARIEFGSPFWFWYTNKCNLVSGFNLNIWKITTVKNWF